MSFFSIIDVRCQLSRKDGMFWIFLRITLFITIIVIRSFIRSHLRLVFHCCATNTCLTLTLSCFSIGVHSIVSGTELENELITNEEERVLMEFI